MIPDTLFGTLGALSGPTLTTAITVSKFQVITRIPLVLAYTWLNLFIFDLANQRNSEAEDRINKPNRPIPSGKMTSNQMRKTLLVSIPIVISVSYYLDAWLETLLIFVLTWMYNDLSGGDHFVTRNIIISFAFGLYNLGALRVACQPGVLVTNAGYCWTGIVSCVILSSMHIQDLKDQAGDRIKERSTAPLFLGDMMARWTIFISIVFWSVICPLYFKAEKMALIVCFALGTLVAARTLLLKGKKEDKKTWELWALWLIVLYCLPLSGNSP